MTDGRSVLTRTSFRLSCLHLGGLDTALALRTTTAQPAATSTGASS